MGYTIRIFIYIFFTILPTMKLFIYEPQLKPFPYYTHVLQYWRACSGFAFLAPAPALWASSSKTPLFTAMHSVTSATSRGPGVWSSFFLIK